MVARRQPTLALLWFECQCTGEPPEPGLRRIWSFWSGPSRS